MRRCHVRPTRRGTIIPLLAACLVGLFAFVALAVDLGVLAVSRTDCQDAADAAALVGARMLNNKPGVADSNRPAAIAAARDAVTANFHLSTHFVSTQIQSVEAGQYTYDSNPSSPTYQQFVVRFPPAIPSTLAAGQSWSAMRVVLAAQQPTYFMRVMGVNGMPTGARAVAVHRPRDIALILDMTGSMGYSSLTNLSAGLNDPSTLWPQFGHYQRYTAYSTNKIGGSETNSTVANRPNPFQQMGTQISAPYVYSPANLTIETPNGPAIIRDFYFDPANLSNPATPVATTNGSNLRNAFHQWRPAESGADPANNIGPTYDCTGYDPLDRTGASGALPAPENFKDQSDSPIPYAGDKAPRKYGAATGTTWSPTNTNGAAITLAEYLGWVARYSSGSTLPTTMTGGTFTGRTWQNFRDRTWETYGYDMDVADYIARRGGSHDPRNLLPSNTTGGVSGQVKVTAGRFQGYSMGPGYFGKTFFVWPPDPRTPVGNPGDAGYVPGDWRRRFFLNRSGGAFDPQSDADTTTSNVFDNINQKLLTSGTGATLKGSSGNWQVNYTAVLRWIRSGPMTLPPNLRSGRVLYYSSIPDNVTVSGSDSADVKADKVFWKAYIDYVLQAGALAGNEPVGWPEGVTPAVYQSTGTAAGTCLTGYNPGTGADPRPYMCYTDNPSRPRLHFWFGPLTMLLFLNEYNYWSGSTHQAQCWQLKVGVNSALDDIRNNHPNDLCGMVFFTRPYYTSIIVPIGQDWPTLKNSLFFPRSLLTSIPTDPTAEWRPYDSSGLAVTNGNIPNAQNTTDPVTGLALAYNVLSPSPNVNTDPARRGRRGAAKIVIFETDGVPNATQPFNLQKAGYNSYYTYGGSTPNTDPSGAAYDVVTQICKPTSTVTTTGVDSGHSLPNAPARVYAIGFGDIFSTSAGPTAASFLLGIQKRGNTSASTDTAIPAHQIITGTYQTRIDNLRTALERIVQSGVQVTLIE
jgi:Flp pilus assembly protein TadG